MLTLSDFRLYSLALGRTLSGRSRVCSIIRLRDVALRWQSTIRDPLNSFLQQSNLTGITKKTQLEK